METKFPGQRYSAILGLIWQIQTHDGIKMKTKSLKSAKFKAQLVSNWKSCFNVFDGEILVLVNPNFLLIHKLHWGNKEFSSSLELQVKDEVPLLHYSSPLRSYKVRRVAQGTSSYWTILSAYELKIFLQLRS